MNIKTADEEAARENFIFDIYRIGKEVAEYLNKIYARDFSFTFSKESEGCRIIIKPQYTWKVELLSSDSKNKKITYEIICIFYSHDSAKRENAIYLTANVPVSHREIYTKKEIERAKKSLMVKVLEGFKKKYSDD